MATRRKLTDYERRRRQDIFVLTTGALILVAALTMSGALSWAVGFTAFLLVAGGGYAYHLGVSATSRVATPAGKSGTSKSGKKATRKARQALIDALGQPALVIDASGQLAAYNAQASAIFGLPPVRPGLSASSLRHPDLLAEVDRVLGAGGQGACEVAPAREPSQSWLAQITALDSNKVGTRAALIVMVDQAPIRRAEKARADFLANASHELRTPLTSISGFLETMQGPARDDTEAWPRFIEIMSDQTRHMKAMITDLLSLSRIELSEHQAPTEKVDLVVVAGETVEALRQVGHQKSQAIELDAPDETLPVIAVESELRQVVLNLVGNALKYSEDGAKITVSVGRSRDLEAAEAMASRGWSGARRATLLSPPPLMGPTLNQAAWLRVRDQGPGIASEFLPRLGERFFRVDQSRGGPVEGTGLGLAIVKHIMAHHRGGFAVESCEGDGTAFSIWLPAPPARSI
ncbi:MAG: ATP-binding protein [Pseudomonadota bacterium]